MEQQPGQPAATHQQHMQGGRGGKRNDADYQELNHGAQRKRQKKEYQRNHDGVVEQVDGVTESFSSFTVLLSCRTKVVERLHPARNRGPGP